VFQIGTSDGVQETAHPTRSAYSIFMPTFFQGKMPAWYDDESGYPVVYETELEAQREIADYHLTLINQFLDGERDFDDAMTVEDFILSVDVWPDGKIFTKDGRIFGKQD
jgi:hypothetical protein